MREKRNKQQSRRGRDQLATKGEEQNEVPGKKETQAALPSPHNLMLRIKTENEVSKKEEQKQKGSL